MLDFFRKHTVGFKDEVLSGLTVALALVPEAIAFALIAGLSPLTGLYAAFMVGLITAAVGGAPGHDLGGNRCVGSCHRFTRQGPWR